MGFLEKIFGSYSQRELKRIEPIAKQVFALEDQFKAMSDEELKGITPKLKEQLAQGYSLDSILPEAFAACREAAWRVIGLLEPEGRSGMGMDKDDVVIIPLNTFQRRLSGNVRVPLITVAVEAGSDIERVKESARLLLRERRSLSKGEMDNFNILDTSELIETISKTSQVMTMLLGAVAAVSLLVGGIGIMNIMLVSVTERTREIGVRLAIGALEREVLLQFLIESVMLACFGGLLGVALALGASLLLTHIMNVPFIFSPSINILAFGFAACIGIVFGYFPARRAAKLDPIEAVRHE